MRALSIFGIVWHALAFVCLIGFMDSDPDAAIGWGMFSAMFGIGASIAYVSKFKAKSTDVYGELVKMKQALDMGAITQLEYDAKKAELSK